MSDIIFPIPENPIIKFPGTPADIPTTNPCGEEFIGEPRQIVLPPEEQKALKEAVEEIRQQIQDPESLRLCNCAECGTQLVALNDLAAACMLDDKDKLRLGLVDPKAVAGRINGRPYCSRCLSKGYK
jgi:hypothetical protein